MACHILWKMRGAIEDDVEPRCQSVALLRDLLVDHRYVCRVIRALAEVLPICEIEYV